MVQGRRDSGGRWAGNLCHLWMIMHYTLRKIREL
jgi:hypothetical protein